MQKKLYNSSMTEDEIIQNRITSLIALRQFTAQTLVILVGGIVGLLFMLDNKIKFIVILVGVLYAIMLVKKQRSIIDELSEYLYNKKRI